MRKRYQLYLGNEEHDVLIRSLIECKNELTAKGKYTDAIDEVLVKVIQAPIKKVKAQ